MSAPHLLVTGGAGFIGSHFVERALAEGCRVTVLDVLTYAGKREHLAASLKNPHCKLVVADISDYAVVTDCLHQGVTQVVHLAAESHVDNSIAGPAPFIQTNIVGSFAMLEACRAYYGGLSGAAKEDFRFVQVSTDEVYGALGAEGMFHEECALKPNSPYSASKAAGDHLARAWWKTYGLPVIITHCSNNYGPRQHVEKLIPTVIRAALAGKPIPIYGSGNQVRDWIHVEDHCHGLWLALTKGVAGEAYDFSGHGELENIALVTELCAILDHAKPAAQSYSSLITHVADRAGHDWRYAIDDAKAQKALGFAARHSLHTGLTQTVEWYLGQEKA